MRRALLVVLLGLVGPGALAGPAVARTPPRTPPVIGIADQKPGMFTNPLFSELEVRRARYVVPWDAMDGGFQREELFTWMRAARAAGITPLLSFGHSRKRGREKLRPTPAALQREFRRVRINFPWAREWVTWNEPNHCSQPLCNRPELAARYYDGLVRACPSCTILGAEVLDAPNMRSWVTRFRRAARHEPTAWGLHNYIDANRFGTSGTRTLLAATRGQIWFTETGGIVNRTRKVKIPLAEGTRHAARATRWVFDRLVPLSPRIRRVYVYHWDLTGPKDKWDSALLDGRGRPREAFRVVLAWTERARVQRAIAAAKR